MNQKEVLTTLISKIEPLTNADTQVRIDGGDQDVDPPEVIIGWEISGANNINGHTSLGGYKRDNSGNATDRELHDYYECEFDITVRMYDEIEKDLLSQEISSLFSLYRDDAAKFHKDTMQWRTSNIITANNPVMDPDWFESVVNQQMTYVYRKDEGTPDDALTDLNINQTGNEPDETTIDVTTN